jgi:hypothetical protein
LQRRRCNKVERVSGICQYDINLLNRPLPETYLKRLVGRTDIEEALKRLDDLTREEVQLAIAQILNATKELKDGARSR